MITPLVFLTIHATLAGTLLENGDFEKGMQGWNVQNSWYENP